MKNKKEPMTEREFNRKNNNECFIFADDEHLNKHRHQAIREWRISNPKYQIILGDLVEIVLCKISMMGAR